VAFLVTDGFEQVELTSPKSAVEEAGGSAVIVAPAEGAVSPAGKVRGWKHTEWGDTFGVDVALEDARASDFHALVLPGGVMNPDRLRRNADALSFVRAFFEQHKPVAAICHGPWTLIDAGVVEGRRMTSYHSIQTDLKNAGAAWVDQPVVVDQGLVTSRNPDDLGAFNAKVLEEIAEGRHAMQTA